MYLTTSRFILAHIMMKSTNTKNTVGLERLLLRLSNPNISIYVYLKRFGFKFSTCYYGGVYVE